MQSTRRDLLSTVSSVGLMTVFSSQLAAKGLTSQAGLDLANLGPLQQADSLGLRLPRGFSARIVAESGHQVSSKLGPVDYMWHGSPDGGACFATQDGGWIYTSNSEIKIGGGAGALKFDAAGNLIDAYSILNGTRNNCGGGPTPWNTWLSCEEVGYGDVYECDIYGRKKAQICPGLGRFKHEAIAIDSEAEFAYLTEDETDGLLYRYRPDTYLSSGAMNFEGGSLSAARVKANGAVEWLAVPNSTPQTEETALRYQLKGATRFNGGEGIWYHNGKVFFVTKGDNKVWRYDDTADFIECIYDPKTSPTPILSGVDNVSVSNSGHVLVAEDGGDMQIIVINPAGRLYPLVQVLNQDHSEITGPAISPDGRRLYFSSQRGGRNGTGITYEISGNFG